jgi:predicted transcriptional regulator
MTVATTTLTLRLPPALKADLDRLAGETHRTKSYLAAQAIRDYVAAELEIINGIKQAQAEYRAGEFVSHETVMAELNERFKLG